MRLLADEPVSASMDPWMLVNARGQVCLFGFAEQHAGTGGLSWVLSTPMVELEQEASRARTVSGRVYALGRRIVDGELDDEGRVALRLLLVNRPASDPGCIRDVQWLTACKLARHLNVTPPPRAAVGAAGRVSQWPRKQP